MRVYYDETKNALFVDGSKDVYPAQSLSVSNVGNELTVFVVNGGVNVLVTDFSNIQDVNNNTFPTLFDTISYLTGEFARSKEFNIVDDLSLSNDTSYSSNKVEERFDEEVGAQDFDFVLLFENGLSQ